MNVLQKLRSAAGLARVIGNWPSALADHAGLARTPYVSRLRNGLKFRIRPGTDDGRILFEIFVRGCYDIASIPAGATVVDIGANIGIFSIRAGRVAQRVIACEPFPANVELLKAHVAMNAMPHVQVHAVAIAAAPGRSALVLPDDDGYVGRYSLHPGRGSRTIEVECISLDDLVRKADIKRIDLLKVDCQGSEYEILFAASQATLAIIDQLIVECEVFPGRADWSQESLHRYLEARGFAVTNDGNLLHAIRSRGEPTGAPPVSRST